MLPITEILARCQADRERADWLLRASDDVLLRDARVIRTMLTAEGFSFGADFLDMRLAAAQATRTALGDLPRLTRYALDGAARTMRNIALSQGVEGGAP